MRTQTEEVHGMDEEMKMMVNAIIDEMGRMERKTA